MSGWKAYEMAGSERGEAQHEAQAIFAEIWRFRLPLTLFLAAGLLASLVYVHVFAEQRYRAEVSVMPPITGNQPHAGVGRIAALAGAGLLGNEEERYFELFLLGVRSREVAAQLARDTDVMRKLFPQHWNPSTRSWQQPHDALRPLKIAVKTVLGMPVTDWEAPGAADVQELLARRITVVQPRDATVAVLGFEHADPVFAGIFLGRVADYSDAIIRAQTNERLDSRIRYLSQQLLEVSLAEHRNALATLLGEQERRRMFASSTGAFAADRLGVVVVSSRPVTPRLLPIYLLGAGAGLAAGLAVLLVRARLLPLVRQRRRPVRTLALRPDSQL
jgi:uncharacterized protein involved in exopolysaccharide biosynthesis